MPKKIRNALVGGLGALLIRLIALTLRIRVTDKAGLVSSSGHSTPVIFAFWHNQMFLMPYIYRRYMPERRAVCLVSASEDGEMIARVLHRFGLGTIRGSSSRRGKEAYRELAGHLKEGWDAAITPDGPRGPRYQAHIGVVGLAAHSGHRLIPVVCRIKWKIELKSWDRFIIPLPFSLCHLQLDEPMMFPEPAGDDVLETGRAELEKRLVCLTKLPL